MIKGCSNPTETIDEISLLITKISNTNIEVVGESNSKEEQYLQEHLKFIQAANPASNQFFPAWTNQTACCEPLFQESEQSEQSPTNTNLISVNRLESTKVERMQKSVETEQLSQDISSDPTSNLPSARGRRLYDEREIEETIFQEVCKDRWHSNHNPEGKIDLCNDHNNLCEELFRHKISKSWPSGVDLAALLLQSPTPGGRKRTKKAVMSCIRHFFCANEKNQPTAEDLILTPGSDAAYDMLSFVLFCPGDVVLCPTPFTGRIYNDFEERAQVELRAVPSQDMLDIHLDTSIFQQALDEAVTQGQNVRAISLTQPHNPLGLAFDWDQISKLCQWAVKNNLWILIDETFVSHIAKPNKNDSAIKSFVSLGDQSEDLRRKLIWVWSVDKDLCLPGLRFAVIHTQNDEVHKALSRLEIVQPCAPLVQSFIECLFGDLEFMSHFYEKRNHLLADNRHLAMQRLQTMGVPFVKPAAGTSIFLSLRRFIQENTFEEEEILWKRFMSEASFYLNPGMFMGTSDAGWFQLIISMDKIELQEALNRLEAVLNSIAEKDNSAEYEDSLSLSMLPAETSRVPDRPRISSTASGSGLQIAADEKQSEGEKGQQYESNVIQKPPEINASASHPSTTELPPAADNAEGRSPNLYKSQLHLVSHVPKSTDSQSSSEKSAIEHRQAKRFGDHEEVVASPDTLLHSKPFIDSMDDTQVSKASVSSATDYTIHGHQPAQKAFQKANHQKEAPIPEKVVPMLEDLDFITQLVKSSEKNIKALPISPRERKKAGMMRNIPILAPK